MCRFKSFNGELTDKLSSFNTSYVSVQVILKGSPASVITVSIHLMCRFKLFYPAFKLCYLFVSIHLMCRFKYSSYVTLKRIGLVSIHLMCRFKNYAKN